MQTWQPVSFRIGSLCFGHVGFVLAMISTAIPSLFLKFQHLLQQRFVHAW